MDLEFGNLPTRSRIALWGLVLVTGVALLISAWRFRTVHGTQQAELDRIEALARRIVAQAPPPQDVVEQDAASQRQAAKQSAAEALAVPWNALFRELAALPSEGVALLSVEADPARRVLVLTAEAKNPEAMVKWIAQLSGRPALRDVFVMNHRVVTQDPLRPVQFAIRARWPEGRPGKDQAENQ